MSDDRRDGRDAEQAGDLRADEHDVELSALIDGELSGRDEAALRARIARDPSLAERVARLEQVDSALRGLPAPRIPDRMTEALRARIRAERLTGTTAGAPRPWGAPAGRRIGSAALLAAAAAAAFAYWTTVGPGLERAAAPTPRTADRGSQQRPPAPPGVDPDAADELVRASEEELGIAFEYETLADLDVIEELELLELLLALDAAERS